MSDSQVSTKVLTIPNLLTFLRMALIPLFAILLVYNREGWALVLFTIAGVSDGIDGFVARRFKQESELGTIIDPIADKLLMTTAFIMLSWPGVLEVSRFLPVPFWVTATVIGRDVLIVTVAASITVMTGFRDFVPSWLGKASTFVQVVAVIMILVAATYPQLRGFYLPTVYTTVVAFAVFSGVHYIFHVARLMRAAETEKPQND
ncbi:MAG: CDP-alcohol phosphatidyltransferase family protein [Acidobacteriota bacterium]|nr:MAG: CDP-alcohol phosphatidyltransferase family protein [Acidobacteriota bacterium]